MDYDGGQKGAVCGMRDCKGHIHSARRGATPPTVPLAPSISENWRIEEEL